MEDDSQTPTVSIPAGSSTCPQTQLVSSPRRRQRIRPPPPRCSTTLLPPLPCRRQLLFLPPRLWRCHLIPPSMSRRQRPHRRPCPLRRHPQEHTSRLPEQHQP